MSGIGEGSKEDKDDEESKMIPCDGVGGIIFTDNDEKKFYTAFSTCNLTVNLGECVRVNLEDDLSQEGSFSFGFGQIVAIYEDKSEEFFVEIRWFIVPDELSSFYKKT
jgi:hypothetical protein